MTFNPASITCCRLHHYRKIVLLIQQPVQYFFKLGKKRKQRTNKSSGYNTPTKCSRILMPQTHKAVWVGGWHAGKILLGLHFCRGYHRGVLTAGLARLTSYHQSLQACRQAWEIAVTTLSITYSCFLHNLHVQDDEKYFSTSKAHSYRFNLGISGLTKYASRVLYWQQGFQCWWRTGDPPSGARGLLLHR